MFATTETGLPGKTRSLAGHLSVSLVAVPEGCQGYGNRQTGHAPAQLSFLAERSGNRRRVVSAPQFHENHVLTETFAFNLLMGRGWPATQ
jgi:hypothetical protein